MNTAKSSFKLLNKRGNFKFLSCSVNIYPPKSTLQYTGLLFYVTKKKFDRLLEFDKDKPIVVL